MRLKESPAVVSDALKVGCGKWQENPLIEAM